MKTRVPFLVCVFWSLVVLLAGVVNGEPEPGDLFREYTYTKATDDAGGALRVGGKNGESHPDRGSDFDYVNAWVVFPHELDLEDATRVEVVVEKILSHNGTHGLAIQWNDSEWLPLPVPLSIPQPRSEYYHHTCITVPIELSHLQFGSENRFRLRISPEQSWGWPQHLIYGVHLRIYYDATKKEHVAAKLTQPTSGSKIGLHVPLAVEWENRIRRVNRVDYLANYEGVNWEGDGLYRRWHYFFYHGELTHHLGSSFTHPFQGNWDTSWVPDQTEPIQIAARIVDDTGLTYLTPAITKLSLVRPGISVELCKPHDVPANWVTRNKVYQESVEIKSSLANATAARLVWSSWSPGYMNGLFVNDQIVLQTEGPKYRYFDHVVDIKDLSILLKGKNAISTGKTPPHEGKMVHGMEVNWPGIQLLIQRKKVVP